MRYTSLFVVVSLVASSFGASVADVLTDISAVSGRLSTLVTSINAFKNPGGTLAQALAIHTNAGPVGTALDKTTADAKTVPTPISVTDGRSILTALEGLEGNIDTALDGIVARKAAFTALPLGGVPALVKQDLAALSTSTSNLETTLLAVTPSSLLSEANALKARVDAKFAAAIAAYA